jgi:hypothetical protein
MLDLTSPPGDRFVVREISGYSLGPRGKLTTSFSVYDLDYFCVVATYYSSEGGGIRGHAGHWQAGEEGERRKAAEARCRYLNEEHRRWLHAGRWDLTRRQ